MSTRPIAASSPVRPWLALLLPPLTWFVFEIGLTAAQRFWCAAVGGGLGIAWGGASLALCALAARLAWPYANRADDQSAAAPWVARIALLGTGIYVLAITFQTLAALIVPSCVR